MAGLRRWTATHDAHVRAAAELLTWHEHWLRRPDFRRACIHDDTAIDGSMWINWRQAREFCDSAPRGSVSELAILDLAVALGENRYRLSIMGQRTRRRSCKRSPAHSGRTGEDPTPRHRRGVPRGRRRLAGIVEVLAVSAPYPDRGASVLVRVYVEARIAPPVHVTSTTQTRPRGRRRALPPGGTRS